MKYEANWNSLDQRPVPQWFHNAKFGIFIHWGIYSVPAYAPKRSEVNTTGEAYAEWYGYAYHNKQKNYWKHHAKMYGENFRYEDFAGMFKAELFDAAEWASLIQKSGARYATLTSKHHDGYCLWPSRYAWNWNSVDIGPHRDICKELREAFLSENLRFCLYYSLYEWYRPGCMTHPGNYAVQHMIPQLKELITEYQPSMLFTDGEWDFDSKTWHSEEFLAWLFNESPVREDIAVNDRWGKETRSVHGGFYTTEYGEIHNDQKLDPGNVRKWEECRGIGASFGYNRNETLDDYLSEKDLIYLLVDTVSKGGNLHLNIGPASDGTIPVIMQERLIQIGNWLKINGEAIYDTVTSGLKPVGNIRFTKKGNRLYVIFLGFPEKQALLPEVFLEGEIEGTWLGAELKIDVEKTSKGLVLTRPDIDFNRIPGNYAYTYQLTIK